jgi:hypothetical protein
VSLGRNIVQLHDSLGTRHACACLQPGFSSQNGDRAWEVYYWRGKFYCMFYVGKKDSTRSMFIKKCFLFTVGSVCRVKRFATGSRNSLLDVRKVADDETNARKWLRQQSMLLCCGFRCTAKAMGQMYQWWWRICREINVFPQVRISHVLRFISICDLFTNIPSYK